MGVTLQDGISNTWPTRPIGSIAHGAATALERHHRPDEIAEMWGLIVKVIRQIFAAEPGVLKVDCPERRNKRGYRTMRIPESVVVRVLKRLTGGSR